MIILDISNTCDLGDTLYQFGFRQRLYLDAIITNPDYSVTQEGIENGNKGFKQTFAQFKKRHKMDFIAPEYLLDALTLLPLHDYITIDDGYDSYVADDVEVDYEWQGGWAYVTITFSVDKWNKTLC